VKKKSVFLQEFQNHIFLQREEMKSYGRRAAREDLGKWLKFGTGPIELSIRSKPSFEYYCRVIAIAFREPEQF
jgi:hypothetical protein